MRPLVKFIARHYRVLLLLSLLVAFPACTGDKKPFDGGGTGAPIGGYTPKNAYDFDHPNCVELRQSNIMANFARDYTCPFITPIQPSGFPEYKTNKDNASLLERFNQLLGAYFLADKFTTAVIGAAYAVFNVENHGITQPLFTTTLKDQATDVYANGNTAVALYEHQGDFYLMVDHKDATSARNSGFLPVRIDGNVVYYTYSGGLEEPVFWKAEGRLVIRLGSGDGGSATPESNSGTPVDATMPLIYNQPNNPS